MNTTRRTMLSLAALLIATSAWGSDHPNVVIFLADDLGWADVGFHGGPIETPSIDRIAREGAELHRFHADAAGIETGTEKELDGGSLWPAIAEGKTIPRDDPLFFVPEMPRTGSFELTAFDDDWKLVQHLEQDYE